MLDKTDYKNISIDNEKLKNVLIFMLEFCAFVTILVYYIICGSNSQHSMLDFHEKEQASQKKHAKEYWQQIC